MERKVSNEMTCKWQNQRSETKKYVSWALFLKLQAASRQMPFTITTKNVLQFTWRRRTVDSAKEKLKGKFLKNIEHDLFKRGQMAAKKRFAIYLKTENGWFSERRTQRQVFEKHRTWFNCLRAGRWQHIWTRTDDSTEGKWKIMFFSFDYVIKEIIT